MFIETDFIVRYQNSFLGFLWVFLKPFLIFVVLLTVFGIFGSDIEHFGLYLLLGIVLFQFFADGTLFGMQSVLSKAHVVLKIPFAKHLVVLAAVIGALIHFGFAMLIFGGFLIWEGVMPSVAAWGGFIVLILSLALIILGISFFTSLWVIVFRDLGQIWEVFLTALFYLVPIFYPLSIIPEHLKSIFWLNPLTQVIVFSRDILIYDKPVPWGGVLILFATGVVLSVAGYYFFIRKVPLFSEKV